MAGVTPAAADLGRGVAALEVAGNEEAHEEIGQGSEVKHVEPDGKVLAGAHDAGLSDVVSLSSCQTLRDGSLSSGLSLGDRLSTGTKDELLEGVDGGCSNGGNDGVRRSDGVLDRNGGGGGCSDGKRVGDECVNHGV